MPTFYFHNHHAKGDAYLEALKRQYQQVEAPPVDMTFSDQAIFGRAASLEYLRARRNFLYPHSGRPNLIGDILPIWDGIDAEFIAAEGHRQVMRSYGHDRFIHVVGWSLCPIRDFVPKQEARRVLFAPIHPRCHEMDKALNRAVFELLRPLDIELRVHYIGSLEESGLERIEAPHIEYIRGELRPNTDKIDEADVVVGHQTFGYLAVARGVPTVMFGEDMLPHLIPHGQPPLFPKNWKRYHLKMRYPFDIQDGNPMAMLEKAIRPNEAVEAWKARMIGKPFNANLFLQKLARYL